MNPASILTPRCDQIFGVIMKLCVTSQILMRIPVRGAQSQKLGCNALSPEFAK